MVEERFVLQRKKKRGYIILRSSNYVGIGEAKKKENRLDTQESLK